MLDMYKNYLLIFTDGSKNTSSTGCALFIPEFEYTQKFKLKPETTIFTAESYAILQSLEFIPNTNYRKVIILTDSKSVLESILNFSETQSPIISSIILKLVSLQEQQNIKVKFIWIKAHSGLVYNEIVDKMAKEATSKTNLDSTDIPAEDLAHIFKGNILKEWQNNYYKKYCTHPTNYYTINPKITKLKWYHGISICRPFYTFITRLHFGHCKTPSHLFKIKIKSNDLCDCGSPGTIDHIFFGCEKNKIQTERLVSKLQRINFQLPLNMNHILASKNIPAYKLLYEFSTECRITI